MRWIPCSSSEPESSFVDFEKVVKITWRVVQENAVADMYVVGGGNQLVLVGQVWHTGILEELQKIVQEEAGITFANPLDPSSFKVRQGS